jgi:hypothetical protein
MTILSIILGIYAIINLMLIILAIGQYIPKSYLPFGAAYAVCHLIYQIINKKGIFKNL